MVHRPVSPGSLRLMCLRLVSQAIYNYLECRPRLEKYLRLCGPGAHTAASRLVDYVSCFLPQNLRDLLLEFLTQLWFSRLLKMKQKTIEHERMSLGDPSHDHSICGGTTSVPEAQRQTALMGEILDTAMTDRTQTVRFGFTNARSGPVDFSRPLGILTRRCAGLRHLDLTFATDTLLPSQAGEQEGTNTFNGIFAKEALPLCRQLAVANNITTLKLLMCNKQMLKELSKCSKLQVLEMVEASGIQDCDLATFSQGEVRHHLTKLSIKFWSDTQHIKELCESQAPRKIAQGFSSQSDGKVLLPRWAVFLLNCRGLQELQWFEPSQLRSFNPMVGLLTLVREARKWWNLEIENEGDLLDIVIEKPADLDQLSFRWKKIGFDMANDGLSGSPSETALNEHMEFLSSSMPQLTSLTLTLFPTPMAFLTLQGLVNTPAGRNLCSKLTELKVQACHPAHLVSASQVLAHCTSLASLTLEHLQLSQQHHHVVNLDTRELLSWLPPSLATLRVRGFHLLHTAGVEEGEGAGPTYPSITTIEVVFCGSSDPHLLHVACMCPGLEHFTVVVSMTPTPLGVQGGPPAPPQQGMVASHLHSLCHNPHLVECIVLIKVGEGWIQVDDRDMLGELVLGSSSDTLRKIVLFPIRGICGNGLRSLVRAAKEKNICLNIGIGNQRPVKTETNRRTAIDEFALINVDTGCQDYFNDFGSFLDKKISEFEGQFWNDPDWFFGGAWPEQGFDSD